MFAAALLIASLGNVPLESGQQIQNCGLAYRTYGELNQDRSNAVLFPSWFNGRSADLEEYIGPNGFIDDGKYFIISVDALANGVSCSPSNSETQANGDFPKITIGDMVETEHTLLTETLGIQHLHAIVGISMGGMQGFEWAARYPGFADQLVSIVGTPKMGEKDILLWTSMAEKLNLPVGRKEDEAEAGAEEDSGPSEKKGSFLEQILGGLGGILGGEAQKTSPKPPADPNPAGGGAPVLDPRREAELREVLGGLPGHVPPLYGRVQVTPIAGTQDAGGLGASIPLHLRPYNVLRQFGAMIDHDVAKRFGSLENAARAIQSKTLMVIATEDQAVAPDIPRQFAGLIGAQTLETTSSCGHAAFKANCDLDYMAPVVRRFLDGIPEAAPAEISLENSPETGKVSETGPEPAPDPATAETGGLFDGLFN